jgi:hypothetical protein
MAEKSPSASLVRSIEADDREAWPALASDATPARRFITISNTCPTHQRRESDRGLVQHQERAARGIEWQISVVDPLGGSYYVEALTNEYEKRIFEILDEVDKLGGTIKLIEEGWFQKQALLDKLASVVRNPDDNIIPVTVELVRAGATMGDIVEKLKGVWGVYRETPVF